MKRRITPASERNIVQRFTWYGLRWGLLLFAINALAVWANVHAPNH